MSDNLLAPVFDRGCPDCGAPDGKPCHGWCPRHNEPPGDNDDLG